MAWFADVWLVWLSCLLVATSFSALYRIPLASKNEPKKSSIPSHAGKAHLAESERASWTDTRTKKRPQSFD
jgi:hypothetical protein